MAGSIKRKIARTIGCNSMLNKKVLCIKRSLDEVNSILNDSHKKKNKKKRC